MLASSESLLAAIGAWGMLPVAAATGAASRFSSTVHALVREQGLQGFYAGAALALQIVGVHDDTACPAGASSQLVASIYHAFT